jgi:hypothetical protein
MNSFNTIFNHLLTEAQRITISQQEVKKLIDNKDYDKLYQYLYDCLTTNIGWQAKVDKIPKQDKLFYRQKTQTCDGGNPQWAGWTIKSKKPKQTTNNYKLYYSLDDDDAIKLIKGIDSLRQMLTQALSQTNIESASIKIPENMSAYIGHNDRIVIHFFAHNNIDQIKKQIQQTVESWAKSNSITLHARTHTFGQDVGETSYGQRIAQNIVNALKPHIDSGKYNTDQLAAWVIQNFKSSAKDISI